MSDSFYEERIGFTLSQDRALLLNGYEADMAQLERMVRGEEQLDLSSDATIAFVVAALALYYFYIDD